MRCGDLGLPSRCSLIHHDGRRTHIVCERRYRIPFFVSDFSPLNHPQVIGFADVSLSPNRKVAYPSSPCKMLKYAFAQKCAFRGFFFFRIFMPDFCCAPCHRNQLNINSYNFCKQITNTLKKRLLFELGALNFWLALAMSFARHEFAMILLNHSLSCTNELMHVATSCYCKMFFVEHYLRYF